MTIKSCKCCNRAFGYNGGPVILCSKCDELLWGKVKDYLKENPNASIEKVSKETKVKTDIIESFLADDRLKAKDTITNKMIEFNKCEGCGNIIDIGEQYCNSCLEKIRKQQILNEMNNMYKEEKRQEINVATNTGSRMYTGTGHIGKKRR